MSMWQLGGCWHSDIRLYLDLVAREKLLWTFFGLDLEASLGAVFESHFLQR